MTKTATIPVTDFGRHGIVSDRPAAGRSFSELTDADNVRVTERGIATLPQLTEAMSFDETPTYMAPFFLSDNSGGHIVCFDNGDIHYISSLQEVQDITPDVRPTTSDYYFHTQVNNLLVLTNGTDIPWIISQETLQTSGKLEPMANWPSNYRARIFTSFKGYLFAGRVTIDGVENRALAKWSHPLSPGDTDFFWDHTDPTLLSGENQMAVAGRNMMGMHSLRDHVYIYFDTAVWRASEVGGGLVMRFDQVLVDDGCVGPFAFCDVGGRALVFGFHDIYLLDGYNAQSITNGKIEQALFQNARITEKIRLVYYSHRQEVFILIEQKPNLNEADTALIWNARLNAFTSMRIPGINGLGGVSNMYNGVKFGGQDLTYDDLEHPESPDFGISYDEFLDSYNSVSGYDEGLVLYLVSHEDKKLYLADQATTKCHGPENVLIAVDHIDMAQYYGSAGDKMKAIVRIYPYAIGQGTLRWTIGGGDTFNVGKQFWPAIEQDLVNDYAVDSRMAARYLALKVTQGSGEDRNFVISGFEFETMVPHAGRQ